MGGRELILMGSVPGDQAHIEKKIRGPDRRDASSSRQRATFATVGEDRTRAARSKRAGGARGEARREAKSRIEQLARAVGNDEIAKRIANGNATRDQMLAFVAERLGAVRELQVRELALTERGSNWEWWRQTSDSHRPGVTGPDPTRWHVPARAYEDAVNALCRGDLRRGEALLGEAMAREEETTDAMTELVDTSEAWRAIVPDPSLFGALVARTPSSGACAEPTPIRTLVDAICAVEQTVPDMPNRRQRRDPWWTLEEDEEEEGKPDGKGD